MHTIIPGTVPLAQFHGLLLAGVAPRPIAFVSTLDAAGNINLSPFSFFNVFGSNPPLAIFSPARRGRDNTVKHTFENVHEVKECVINMVSYAMVNQTSLASTEYPKGVNEFLKSGFTMLDSEAVKPPRVKESPFQMECIVRDIIETGKEGGAGNLILAEIVRVHIAEEVMNADGKIDQHKIDLVGRLGADWYVRASGDALFEVEKPLTRLGIGVDQLPESIRLSSVLTGNQLGQLGNQEHLPDAETAEAWKNSPAFAEFEEHTRHFTHPHQKAGWLLEQGKVEEALCWLVHFAPN